MRNIILTYNLKRKNIKSIILKLKKDGTIEISAPFGIDKKIIDNFFLSKESWLKEKLENIDSIALKKSILDLGYIHILNDKLYFSLDVNNKLIISKNIILDKIPQEKKQLLKKQLEIYLKQESFKIILPILNKYLTILNLSINSISFRPMKTRWGSCNSYKKYININSLLISSPVEAIEYVILHEIAHLEFPHHQKEFWEFIEKIMPDWKIRRKKLVYYEL